MEHLRDLTSQNTSLLSQHEYMYKYVDNYYEPSMQSPVRITVMSGGESIKLREKVSMNTVNVHEAISRLDKKVIEGVSLLTTVSDLSLLLKRMTAKYPELGHPTLEVVYNPDTSEPAFIEIVFPYGDWETWRRVVKEIKGELRKIGLGDLASKVAITCLQGLKE